MPAGTRLKARGHRRNWFFGTDLSTGVTGWAWLAYLVPAGGQGSTGGGGGTTSGGAYCMTNYWGEWVCAAAWIADAIRGAAAAYGVGAYWLFATAACESSFNPWAYNPSSGVSGLFQFEPSTFYWQGGSSLWSVWEQSYVAAKMFANGLASHFWCGHLVGYW